MQDLVIRIPPAIRLDDITDLSVYVAPAISVMREYMTKDSGHDEAHLVRVVNECFHIIENDADVADSGVDFDVLLPAVILHDLVNVPKDHPDRRLASMKSADKAVELLGGKIAYKSDAQRQAIHSAIASHSYSAGIEPSNVEGRILQDADRLDSLGHIGIVRLFSVGGQLGRALWHPTDPFAKHRELDELTYTLDHVSVKLGKLERTMQTREGKYTAHWRTRDMIEFIIHLFQRTAFFDGKNHKEISAEVGRFVLGDE